MKHHSSSLKPLFSLLAVAVLAAGCADTPVEAPQAPDDRSEARSMAPGVPAGPHTFAAPVFDIAAAPNGNILVPVTQFPAVGVPAGEVTSQIWEIRGNGSIREHSTVQTRNGSPVNGIHPVGRGNLLVTSGGLDLAEAAGLWRVTPGGQQLVGDIESYELANDTDANEGIQWKNVLCEAVPPYTAGPQSNPYHVTVGSGGTALVADAAGNSLLSVHPGGEVDWVAIFSPATADGSGSADPSDWMVLFPLDAETDCYVQPVPTSVAVAPDGSVYVGELTGVAPADLGAPGVSTGLSRVWQIDAGATNVVCPSDACRVAFSGFTSIMDLAFGPDNRLHVVEYDLAGWFAAAVLGAPTTGAIHACDVNTGTCSVRADGLFMPAAITFDTWGGLWVLENHLAEPSVRKLP
jgi:hypothetical protein